MSYIDNKAYNAFVQETAIFQPNRGISYCISKLCGEVGEVCDKITMILASRGGFTDHFFCMHLDKDETHGLLLELGDCCWYITALAGELGYSLADVLERRTTEAIIYQDAIHMLTMGLRLAALSGGISERSGKIIRDENGDGTNSSFRKHATFGRQTMNDLGTMLELLDMMANGVNYTLRDVIQANIQKLESRRERGKLSGSGDNR